MERNRKKGRKKKEGREFEKGEFKRSKWPLTFQLTPTRRSQLTPSSGFGVSPKWKGDASILDGNLQWSSTFGDICTIAKQHSMTHRSDKAIQNAHLQKTRSSTQFGEPTRWHVDWLNDRPLGFHLYLISQLFHFKLQPTHSSHIIENVIK